MTVHRPLKVPPRWSDDATVAALIGAGNAALARVHSQAAVQTWWLGHASEVTKQFGATRKWDVLAVGKAAAGMLAGLKASIDPTRLGRTLLIEKAWNLSDTSPASESVHADERYFAEHPVPGKASSAAGQRALAFVHEIEAKRGLLVLLSGGASSLMCAPQITMQDWTRLGRELLGSGLRIDEINQVRGTFDACKCGGLLATRSELDVLTLLISDVPGVEDRWVGGGPTSPFRFSRDDVANWLKRLPSSAEWQARLKSIEYRNEVSTDARSGRRKLECCADNTAAMQAARGYLSAHGFQVHEGLIAGDVPDCARQLATQIGRESFCLRTKGAWGAWVFGGESVVSLPASRESIGRGGRNAALLLELALVLANTHHQLYWTAIVVATDGDDGNSGNAGAIASHTMDFGDKNVRAASRRALDTFDAAAWFESQSSHLVTGPTQTNVADLLIVIAKPLAHA